MCLFSWEGYEEVTRLLAQGLVWARRGRGHWQVPTTGALAQARARLGPEPLKALFSHVCRPVATEATVGAWYHGWRLVAVDATTFDLPDTPANVDHFGHPGNSRGDGKSAYPQAWVAVPAECGTHAIFTAAAGPLATHETKLARELFPSLKPDVAADRPGVSGL